MVNLQLTIITITNILLTLHILLCCRWTIFLSLTLPIYLYLYTENWIHKLWIKSSGGRSSSHHNNNNCKRIEYVKQSQQKSWSWNIHTWNGKTNDKRKNAVRLVSVSAKQRKYWLRNISSKRVYSHREADVYVAERYSRYGFHGATVWVW